MRARVNRTIEAMATEIVPWRGALGRFIIEVVRQWDTRSLAERLEAALGRDLQYIRINGTLVGGLVGCVLYLAMAAFQ
jgi:uncharacterized membrane-anchored protein YjiN (DUF445 family)